MQRGEGELIGEEGKVHIKPVYFIEQAKLPGKDEEEVTIPNSVSNVYTLLAWMRKCGESWKERHATPGSGHG